MAGSDDAIFGNLPPPPSPAPNIDWDAPTLPTFPADPADPRYSMPARIGSALGIQAGRIGQGLWSAATLPGDVATGKTTMADPEAQQRVMNLASTATLGPGAMGPGAPAGALTTGWAPAAWLRLKEIAKTEPEVANKIASLTPTEAPGYFFDADAHNNLLSDVITRHLQDQHLATRTTTPPGLTFGPPPDWRAQLEELRGQRPPQPSQPQPSGPTLEDYLYGSRSNAIQPASTPWNTFKLEPRNMPPFPANDPRATPPPPPPRPWPPPRGTTLGQGMKLRPGELGA
jgi:hypothetical protein